MSKNLTPSRNLFAQVSKTGGALAITAGLLFSAAVPANAVSPEVISKAPLTLNESVENEGLHVSPLLNNSSQTLQITKAVEAPDLLSDRLDVSATTQEELDAIRAEAARVAEEARQAEAARQAEVAQQQAAAAQQQAQQVVTQPASSAQVRTNVASSGSSNSARPAQAPAQQSAVASSGKGSTIANAALGQVGVQQDCVALVRKALAAAGIGYPSMANLSAIGGVIPASQASPGDIIYYANGGTGSRHVGVYIGGGKAVHGGWGGNKTVVAGLYLPGASAPIVYNVG